MKLRVILAPLLVGCASITSAQTIVSVDVAWQNLSGSLTYTRNNGTVDDTTQVGLARMRGGQFGANPQGTAGFCTELRQSLGNGTHSFQLNDNASLAARGSATASDEYGITPGAAGGIGATRAAHLARLFQQQWQPLWSAAFWSQNVAFTNIPDNNGALGSITIANAHTYAFQLAVWELTHDSDFDLNGGNFRLLTSKNLGWDPPGAATSENGRAINAVKSLAQAWIDDAKNNPIAGAAPLQVLLNDSFVSPAQSPNNLQDLVVPEPSTYALIASGLALLAAGWARQRRLAAAKR